jgi:hypothetical protein
MFHAIRAGGYLSDSELFSGGKDTWPGRMVVFNQFERWIWAGERRSSASSVPLCFKGVWFF